MKNLVLAIASIALIMVFSNPFYAQDSVDSKDSKFEKIAIKTSVKCNNCKAKIEKNIPFEKGVKDLNVDLENKIVTIKYNKEKTTPEELEAALQKLDFETEIVKCTSTEHKCSHASPTHKCNHSTENHDCKGVNKSEETKKCCNKKEVKKCCNTKTENATITQ